MTRRLPSILIILILVYAGVAQTESILPGELLVSVKQNAGLFVNTGSRWEVRTEWQQQSGLKQLTGISPAFTEKLRQKSEVLSRVWLCSVNPGTDLYQLIRDLESCELIEYAEPRYLRRTSLSPLYPDDPLHSSQWFLEDIEAYTGWAITTGDTAVTIAILDTGVNWQHEDLAANIAINPAEDINGNGVFDPEDLNGLDDDMDQYVDNVIGWDFVAINENQLWPGEDGYPPDNDPMDFDGHGTHCAGDASAVTDNNTGVAGLGWKTRIMPVRVGYQASDGNGYVGYSLEGINYALDHGADVISMSYGGTGFSSTAAALMEYAASAGVVLVAAAGNENTSDLHYPAGYDHVIAVAATTPERERAAFSNYGDWVDVAAPGVQIQSTTVSGAYGNMGGTSMATPITAGLCGLVKGLHPEWNSDSLEHHLRTHGDTLATFLPEDGGRHINARKALDIIVRVDSMRVDDSSGNGNGLPEPGEEVSLWLRIRNSLADLDYVFAYISSQDSVVDILDEQSSFGAMMYGEYAQNDNDPIRFQITDASPTGRVVITLTLLDASGYTSVRDLVFQTAVADWLVINHDESDAEDQSWRYVDALGANGWSSDVWRISQQGSPEDMLSRYESIIWFTGVRQAGDISEADGDALADFLSSGGNLFLTGQNAVSIFTSELPEFSADWLQGGVTDPDANMYVLTESTEGVIGNGGTVYIFGGEGAGNQSQVDALELPEGGVAEIRYGSGSGDPVAAWTRENGCRLFVCGFGFEAINGDPPGSVTPEDLMQRVGNWFDGEEVRIHQPDMPAQIQLDPPYPNPFNGQTTIHFTLVRSAIVKLSLVNILGEEIAVPVNEQLPPGEYTETIQAENLASGVYILQLVTPNLVAREKLLLIQ